MTKNLHVGRWDINISNRAKRSWTDFKRFKTDAGFHWVWGRLSLLVEDGTAEVVACCAACGSDEVSEKSMGDEGWTVCDACCGVEQGYVYKSKREMGL